MDDKTLRLPLLITRGLVLFPNNLMALDAARPFSLKAIEISTNECDSLILITTQKKPETEKPESMEDIFDTGVVAKIIQFSEQKGYVRIKVKPISRIKLTNIEEENETFVADCSILEDIVGDHKEEVALVRNITEMLESVDGISLNMPKSLINQFSKGVSANELSDSLAHYLPLPIERKQAILETLEVNVRLRLILEYLSDEKEIAELDRRLEGEVRRAAEKSQKEYFLREKMKAIKTELGEDDTSGSIEKLQKKIEENPYPEYVKLKFKAEARRYEMMPQSSLEASMILNYLDWLVNTPWYQTTEDTDDLKRVQEILDEDHYGLDKVKKRIVEYLAVKKMTKSLKAPILCFYGPPGVGKTSLGKSIARALGRKFFKAALGGISDEAEIRGHRRTYVGSMPGRIISGMKKCGTINPVFLLDEVDKLASSNKGDPASALLEVLDPEQNFQFNDNYLEEPFDLSNVLFIATANQIENIPGPLRDRMEMIEVPSYTEIEKIHIAVEHLVPKQMLLNGLENHHVFFEEEAILYIIRRYTRESGVRNLDRVIGSCCRKIVVDILSNDNKDKEYTVTVDLVKEYLGLERFEDSEKEKEDQVGVVQGLAYTQYGGDILPIEVTHFKGKGGLVLTGSLGDVMKESSAIALDYVRSNATKYGINPEIFMGEDIHIHFPEGAVPKDGPSAGVAITLAIISSLTGRKVKSSVAMTGEVTLRGKALPIGGLREKSLAAARSGIATIIIPRDNEKNLDEIPVEVREKLNIILMDTVDDAIAIALGE